MDGTHDESRLQRRALVETLERDGHLRSPRVAEALLTVPRELFLPGVPLDDVYCSSEAIVTKRVDGVSVSSASANGGTAYFLHGSAKVTLMGQSGAPGTATISATF